MSDVPRLPRAPNQDQPMVVTGRLWDRLCDYVEQALKLTVSPPLFMTSDPGGKSIGAMIGGPNVVSLELTANETGGGYYKALQLTGNASLSNGSSTLNEPLTGMSVPTNRDVLVFNPLENGSTNHTLLSAGGGGFGAGLIVGMTTEASPRPIAMWLGNQVVLAVPCVVSKSSGSDGGTSSACTYLYDATNCLGANVGHNLPVANQRANGSMKPATIAFQVFGGNGTGVLPNGLWLLDEVPNTDAPCQS